MDSLFTFSSTQMKAALTSLKMRPIQQSITDKTALQSSRTTNSSDVRETVSRSLGTPQPLRKLSLRRKVTFDVRGGTPDCEVDKEYPSPNDKIRPSTQMTKIDVFSLCTENSTLFEPKRSRNSDKLPPIHRCVSFMESKPQPSNDQPLQSQDSNQISQSVNRGKRQLSLKMTPKTAVPLSDRKLPKAFKVKNQREQGLRKAKSDEENKNDYGLGSPSREKESALDMMRRPIRLERDFLDKLRYEN